MNTHETIAAISTAVGEGGIGIVRISGPGALDAAGRVFTPARGDCGLRERYLAYGRFHAPGSGECLDDGYATFMSASASYTGELVAELYCHGGPLVLKRVLEAVFKAGARPAGPGEFTRQAFLNGRLDLAQAEAVIDVIRARSDEALRSARAQLDGAFSNRIDGLKDRVADLLARIEAELDFPEEEGVPGLGDEEILTGLDAVEKDARRLLDTFGQGRALKEGVKTIIIGAPNVGKSSLLNRLLKEERAIVTEHPGTTRDVIEEAVNIKGVAVRLMDTAGLRETADFVEAIGVRAAREKLDSAGLVILVVDASRPAGFSDDLKLLGEVSGKKVIVAGNKADIAGADAGEELARSFAPHEAALVSALTGDGIDALEELVYEKSVGRPHGLDVPAGEVLTSVRHKDSLERALEGLTRTRAALRDSAPREVVSGELRWALARLGEITGEVTTEDILEKIFSGFCIGK